MLMNWVDNLEWGLHLIKYSVYINSTLILYIYNVIYIKLAKAA
jgi:predicted nucleic acid-binding protein